MTTMIPYKILIGFLNTAFYFKITFFFCEFGILVVSDEDYAILIKTDAYFWKICKLTTTQNLLK